MRSSWELLLCVKKQQQHWILKQGCNVHNLGDRNVINGADMITQSLHIREACLSGRTCCVSVSERSTTLCLVERSPLVNIARKRGEVFEIPLWTTVSNRDWNELFNYYALLLAVLFPSVVHTPVKESAVLATSERYCTCSQVPQALPRLHQYFTGFARHTALSPWV